MWAKLIIVASVLFGLLAGAAIGYLAKTSSPVESRVAEPPESERRTNRLRQRHVPEVVLLTNETTFAWGDIETPDYKAYIANLRSIGCPEETIRDIIIADVNKLYAPQIAALRPSLQGREPQKKYWESQSPWGSRANREAQRQLNRLQKEKSALLKELLGGEPEKLQQEAFGWAGDGDEHTYIAADKRDMLRDVLQKFGDREQELYAKAGGFIDEETQKDLARIRKERSAELAKFLSPQELEDYEIRNSEIANSLRWNMAGFNQTEEEFKLLYRSRKAYEDQYGSGGSLVNKDDPAAVARWQEARKKRDEDLKAALGTERYAQYERGKDYTYQELARLTDRWELPKDTATKIYDMKKEAEAQVKEVRNNAALTPEQKKETLKAIREETEKTVTLTLGEKAFKNYRNSSGYWMRNLEGSGGPAAVGSADP